MSKKYVIEIKPEYEDTTKGVMVLGARGSDLYVDALSIENLEELNSDYINEHFGDLQDTAYKRGLEEGKKATWELVADASNAEYQRGLEDGKGAIHKGCEGCRYSGTPQGDSPCFSCSNYYPNNWQKQDDKINVGDEVDWSGDKFIVTRIFQPHNNAEECDGVDMDGCTYHDVLISGLTKTGRHVDITDMLKGALE